ncbi:MAG TPA: WbqC family protein [Bacteroidales bacterium]|nr:WbqC family protein [Bacteroidales bacterium]
MIFTTAYLPPVEFFVYASKSDNIVIEGCENFIKQTYRNRCCIYSANGRLNLIIPLEHCRSPRLPVKDVKIAYTTSWNKIHWRAITAAYNKSAYFLYYRDNFEKYFSLHYKWLIEFNHDLIAECLRLIRYDKPITYSEVYHKSYDSGDHRYSITPKATSELIFPIYTQVFDIKYGFIANLSIIDLLFNCGPESRDYIRTIAQGI